MSEAMSKTWREHRAHFYKKHNISEEEVANQSVKMAIAQLIYDHRSKAKLSQQALARQMGLKQQFIARVESGGGNLTLETIVKFLNTLNIVLKVEAVKRKRAHEKVLQFV